MKYTSILRIISILVLGGILPASGAVIVTNSVSAPTEDILRSQIPTGDPLTQESIWIWKANQSIGQSFYFDANTTITDVSLLIKGASMITPGTPFTLNIIQTDAAAQNPSTGSLLSSQSGSMPLSMITDNSIYSYLTFTLGSSVELDAGKYYFFEFNRTATDSAIYVSRIITTNSDANNSYLWGYDAGAWSRNSGRSTTMYLQGVPEPSSLALLAAGSVFFTALAFYRRRNLSDADRLRK